MQREANIFKWLRWKILQKNLFDCSNFLWSNCIENIYFMTLIVLKMHSITIPVVKWLKKSIQKIFSEVHDYSSFFLSPLVAVFDKCFNKNKSLVLLRILLERLFKKIHYVWPEGPWEIFFFSKIHIYGPKIP